MPKIPNTSPGRGVGSIKSLKPLGPNLWISSFDNFYGRLIILMALNGHLFMHIPQPMHFISLIKQRVELGYTLIHNLVSKFGLFLSTVIFTGQIL